MRRRQVLVFLAGAAAVCGGGPLAVACAAGGGTVPAAGGAAGSWGRAIEVPGLAALSKGGGTYPVLVSCGSAGNCAAGGMYTDRHGRYQGFVVSERNGRWGRAIEVPGLAALNTGSDGRPGAGVNSVSCGSAGNCVAGGFYQDQQRHTQGFVASERNGRWGRAIEVPGLAALNKDGDANVTSVSCPPAGNCVVGGSYMGSHGHYHPFVT